MPVFLSPRPARWFWRSVFTAASLTAGAAAAQPVAVVKTNPLPVYMHYMPWFDTPATLGGNQWGWHWRMNTQNPNVVGPDGQRQIASHYDPLIGPYDSRDPDVVEYHLHLMKLSGIDGVLIDWYGVQGTNADIGLLLTNANALIDQVDDIGVDFGVVLEDRFAANVAQTQANVAYLRDQYFNHPRYLRDADDRKPLLGVFGPITWESPSQWSQILSAAGEPVDLVTLPYQSAEAGVGVSGEFAWPFEVEAQDNHLQVLSDFLVNRAPSLEVAGGVAYPGFDDFYLEGGVGDVVGFEIPHASGQTLADTLALNAQHAASLDFLQLATWNDFGEGTMFEPTVQTGFSYLLQLQAFTGVPYGQEELELVHELYLARKASAHDAAFQAALDVVSANLAAMEIVIARTQLAALTGTLLPGDFNDNGSVEQGDLDLVLNNWGLDTDAAGVPPGWRLLPPSGVVDQAELDAVLNAWGNGSAALAAGVTLPEPGIAAAAMVALAGWTSRRQRSAAR